MKSGYSHLPENGDTLRRNVMLRRVCPACNNEVTRSLTPAGELFFCETCQSDTVQFDLMEMDPCCPDCGSVVEFCVKCGSGYFCGSCRSLKSSKKIVWKRG
jgi:hypothetical protein